MTIKQYYSHGKFLISGEYLILHGAKGLTIPLRFGQTSEIYYSGTNKSFSWFSLQQTEQWFSARFDSQTLAIRETTDQRVALFVQKLLKVIKALQAQMDYTRVNRIINHLDFNRNWGLGSSSTIINNMAHWADINPFDLHFAISNGSGYDIAAALSEEPVCYHLDNGLPKFKEANFNPVFHDKLYFVYLGKKQSSEKSVNQFNAKEKPSPKSIHRITEITEEIIDCKDFTIFLNLISEHENIIAQSLRLRPAKELHFSDFKGEIKSLGAWGGDFILAATDMHEQSVNYYFKEKGFETILKYNDIIHKGIKRVGDIK